MKSYYCGEGKRNTDASKGTVNYDDCRWLPTPELYQRWKCHPLSRDLYSILFARVLLSHRLHIVSTTCLTYRDIRDFNQFSFLYNPSGCVVYLRHGGCRGMIITTRGQQWAFFFAWGMWAVCRSRAAYGPALINLQSEQGSQEHCLETQHTARK